MSIACGHCHGRHETPGGVWLCSGSAGEAREDAQARADKLDPGVYELPDGRRYSVQRSQRSGHNYAKLFSQETKKYEYAPGHVGEIKPEHAISKAGASRPASAPDPEQGTYQDGKGLVFSVKIAVHGSGNLVARQLIIPDPGKTSADGDPEGMGEARPYWDYLGLARNYLPADAKLMTLEEAEAFGKLYGVCCDCGTVLTNPESIERGIGPVCAGKRA
jgi:hypothetical protein